MAINFQRLENITRAMQPLYQDGQCFHTTFAFHGNRLLAIGMNQYSKLHRHHKLGVYKSTKGSSKNYQSGIHSEAMTILKLGIDDCSRLTFVNIRIDNKNQAAVSKPCPNCYRLLKEYGFKNLYYHDGKEYIKERKI